MMGLAIVTGLRDHTRTWMFDTTTSADDCLEAFYDRSRNRSRIWCDMADCGNLAKVRTHRERAAAGSDQR